MDYSKLDSLCKEIGKSDIKATVACIYFMLHNAAKYDVNDNILATELQQLGN